MTLEDFIITYIGKKVDFDGSYGAQCVDLFRQYNKDVWGNPHTGAVKGAKDFLSVFLPISFEEAQRLNYKFTVDIMKKLNKTKDDITFFSCRHLTDDNKCLIHDKRPDFCRHCALPDCTRDCKSRPPYSCVACSSTHRDLPASSPSSHQPAGPLNHAHTSR